MSSGVLAQLRVAKASRTITKPTALRMP
jgi:hypothetical protein